MSSFRKIVSLTLLAFIFPLGRSGAARDRMVPEMPPPGEKIRVIIDTDAACEIDDRYAIALAILFIYC